MYVCFFLGLFLSLLHGRNSVQRLIIDPPYGRVLRNPILTPTSSHVSKISKIYGLLTCGIAVRARMESLIS